MDEVNLAIRRAEEFERTLKERSSMSKQDLDNLRENLKAEFPHLVQSSADMHGAVLVTKNLRIELKRLYPLVKFVVRAARTSAVTVRWQDGPSGRAIEEGFGKYRTGQSKSGRAGSTTAWHNVFGGVQILSFYRDTSDGLVERAISAVWEKHAGDLNGIPRPTIAAYRGGLLGSAYVQGEQVQLGTLIHAILHTLS